MVLLYVVFIVGLGFYFARRTKTTDDYFLAGRSLTWWLIGFSLFASNVSSSTLVGLSSSAFSSGISVYNYEWMAALVLIVFLVFFLPFYLKTRVFTMPEFLERRFDQRSRYYFSALLVLMNITIDTANDATKPRIPKSTNHGFIEIAALMNSDSYCVASSSPNAAWRARLNSTSFPNVVSCRSATAGTLTSAGRSASASPEIVYVAE